MLHINYLQVYPSCVHCSYCLPTASIDHHVYIFVWLCHINPNLDDTYIRSLVHVRKCVTITNMFLNSFLVPGPKCHGLSYNYRHAIIFIVQLYITKSACCLSWVMHVKSTIMYMQSPIDNKGQASKKKWKWCGGEILELNTCNCKISVYSVIERHMFNTNILIRILTIKLHVTWFK